MHNIRIRSTDSVPRTTPYRVAPFTVSTADLRAALIDRNSALRAKNPHLDASLRAITGSETDRALEDIFVANYFHVASSMFCNQALAIIQVACYALGIFSGSGVFLTIEAFVRDLWVRISDAVIEFYETMIRPENVVFNCSEFVMRTSTPKSQLVNRIFGGMAAVCADRVKDNAILAGVFELVQTYCRGSFNVFFSVYNVPTLNHLLEAEIPESRSPGHSTVLSLARNYCESTVKKAKENTAARAANASPVRRARPDHRADSVPAESDDTILPSSSRAPAQTQQAAPRPAGPVPVPQTSSGPSVVVATEAPIKSAGKPDTHPGWHGTMYADD
jgi:hypothetical protein